MPEDETATELRVDPDDPDAIRAAIKELSDLLPPERPKNWAITIDGNTVEVRDLKIGVLQGIADRTKCSFDGVINCLGQRSLLGPVVRGDVLAELVDAAVTQFGKKPSEVLGVDSATELPAHKVESLFDLVDEDLPLGQLDDEGDDTDPPSGGGTSTPS